jgi:hypothetical protein
MRCDAMRRDATRCDAMRRDAVDGRGSRVVEGEGEGRVKTRVKVG